MNKEKVDFSVIIPTFNREDLLKEALKSAHDALPTNGELVVINDGSQFSDSVLSLIIKLEANVTTTSGSLGAGAARNLGAERARGRWLLFLDDDDLISKDYWSAVKDYIDHKLMDETKAYGFCKISSHSDRNQMKTLTAKPGLFHFDAQEDQSIKSKIAGLGQGFWVSKSLFEKVGGIDPNLKTNEDTDFCLRLLSAGGQPHKTIGIGAFIFTGDHGRSAAQSTTKRHGPKQRASYFKHIIDTNSEILTTDPKAMRWLWKRYLKMAIRSGEINGLNDLWAFPDLAKTGKLSLALYWILWAFISIFYRP
ncbi:glycosyltransferase family 2 protein [uncultured Planktomarina sp.]|jgi:glycosyltransferase involved in cell wall biosynthesis|uniref:glycosyltransferase family 2 protein n=1 Tax=uncultured Planktomarina sp. TaxID=1538529 RepID=UPI0032607654